MTTSQAAARDESPELIVRSHVEAKSTHTSRAPSAAQLATNIVGTNALVKRGLDIVGAAILLVIAAPLMVLVALGIKVSSSGPIFFIQVRVGYKGRLFPFIKFRSMCIDHDDAIHRDYIKRWIKDGEASAIEANGERVHKIVNDPRVFGFGRLIRKYSIDELPQLINVLRGDMSLVGPRPALPYEVEVYTERHRLRFQGPPGLTGLWQVSGRNRLTFDEMVELDIHYLEHWSFFGDLWILAKTARVVVFEPAS